MGLFDSKKSQSDFYKSFPNQARFSEDFKKYIENQIRWNYWYHILAYPVVKGNNNVGQTQVISLPSPILYAPRWTCGLVGCLRRGSPGCPESWQMVR